MNNGINYKLGEICEIRSGYSGNQLLSKKGLKVSRIETISGHKVNIERVGYVAPLNLQIIIDCELETFCSAISIVLNT